MRWIAASNRREAVTPGISDGQRSPGLSRRMTINSLVMDDRAKKRVKEEERVFDHVSGLFQVVSCGGNIGTKSRRMREFNVLKRLEKDKIVEAEERARKWERQKERIARGCLKSA